MKNNQDNQIQNVTLFDVYFLKKTYILCTMNGVWGKAPEAGEFSRIFVLKVTLQLLIQKKIGGAPQIILLG